MKAIVLKGNPNNTTETKINASLTSAMLEQNAPNPFANTTAIRYSLPQKFAIAQIVITDKNGTTIKQVKISGSGNGPVNVDATSLLSGTYAYSLVVDEKMISTKQMMITK